MEKVVTKLEVLRLYKTLLKEASKFSSYNLSFSYHQMFFVTGPQPRMYALRRIKSRFQENKTLKDPVLVEFYINDGKNNVDIIRRQVIINDLYKSEKLVIE